MASSSHGYKLSPALLPMLFMALASRFVVEPSCLRNTK